MKAQVYCAVDQLNKPARTPTHYRRKKEALPLLELLQIPSRVRAKYAKKVWFYRKVKDKTLFLFNKTRKGWIPPIEITFLKVTCVWVNRLINLNSKCIFDIDGKTHFINSNKYFCESLWAALFPDIILKFDLLMYFYSSYNVWV